MSSSQVARPGLALALLPIVLTFGVLGVQLFAFGDFTPHVPLIIGIAITALVGRYLGLRWQQLEAGMLHVVSIGLPAVGILMLVGMITGVWIASGTVPTLIYFGLELLSPQVFLAAAALLCAVVSVSLGTSWGHRGHGGPGADGHRRRLRYPGLLDRGRGGLRCLLRRQGLAAVRYHQPGPRRDRREPVRSYPQPDADHAAGDGHRAGDLSAGGAGPGRRGGRLARAHRLDHPGALAAFRDQRAVAAAGAGGDRSGRDAPAGAAGAVRRRGPRRGDGLAAAGRGGKCAVRLRLLGLCHRHRRGRDRRPAQPRRPASR